VIRVHWSPEDRQHVATTDAYPSLSWLADTQADALAGLKRLMLDIEEGRA
jgi:hypothetical protein